MAFGFNRKKSFDELQEEQRLQAELQKIQGPQIAARNKLLNTRRKNFGRTAEGVAQSLGEFGGVGSRGADFSEHQEALRGMFGHGEKIWGHIGEPVRINNDLNPRQRGETGTAEMFGF